MESRVHVTPKRGSDRAAENARIPQVGPRQSDAVGSGERRAEQRSAADRTGSWRHPAQDPQGDPHLNRDESVECGRYSLLCAAANQDAGFAPLGRPVQPAYYYKREDPGGLFESKSLAPGGIRTRVSWVRRYICSTAPQEFFPLISRLACLSA